MAAVASAEVKKKRVWLPLESNPDVLNEFSQRLGLLPDVSFHDVYGFDDDLLAMVPQPVLALVFLFDLNSEEQGKGTKDSIQQEAAPSSDSDRVDPAELHGSQAGQEDSLARAAETTVPNGVFFIRQTIDNACGTIALLHAIGNNASRLQIAPGSFFDSFFKKAASSTPEERAVLLEADELLETAHSNAAAEGSTRPPSEDESVDLHFVAFVTVNGRLYEMDGRRPAPTDHGSSSYDSFLKDAAVVIQKVCSSGTSQRYNIMALCVAPPE